MLTEQHAAVVEQVAEVLKHRALVLAARPTEVAEEAAAWHDHVGRQVLQVSSVTRRHSYILVQAVCVCMSVLTLDSSGASCEDVEADLSLLWGELRGRRGWP